MLAYLLGALVVMLVLAFVVLPLVRRRASAGPIVAVSPSLAEQRAALYRELTELELDQRVGKVSDADFKEQSEALLARAAALIAAEDAETVALDQQLEREIAEARARLGPAAEPTIHEARS